MWAVQYYDNGIRTQLKFADEISATTCFNMMVASAAKCDWIRNVNIYAPWSY